MKKYALKIPAYGEGCIIYGFDEDDKLVIVDMSLVKLPEAAYLFLWGKLPANSKSLAKLKGKTGIITELVEEVDFAAFWNKYNDKARSSKVKTERVWNKLKRVDQVKAYNYIGKYKASLQAGICMKYATTYLSDELWNN